MYENAVCAKVPAPETVENLIDELSVRLYRSNSIAGAIRDSLVGPTLQNDGSADKQPMGVVGKLEFLVKYVSDTNDVLYDAATILSSNNG